MALSGRHAKRKTLYAVVVPAERSGRLPDFSPGDFTMGTRCRGTAWRRFEAAPYCQRGGFVGGIVEALADPPMEA